MYALKNKELTASGQVTTKLTAGTNTLSAPARVLGLNIKCGATLGKVDLIDNGSGGTVKFTIPTPAIGAGEDEILQVTFPDPALTVIDLALALPCPFKVPPKFIFEFVVSVYLTVISYNI